VRDSVTGNVLGAEDLGTVSSERRTPARPWSMLSKRIPLAPDTRRQRVDSAQQALKQQLERSHHSSSVSCKLQTRSSLPPHSLPRSSSHLFPHATQTPAPAPAAPTPAPTPPFAPPSTLATLGADVDPSILDSSSFLFSVAGAATVERATPTLLAVAEGGGGSRVAGGAAGRAVGGGAGRPAAGGVGRAPGGGVGRAAGGAGRAAGGGRLTPLTLAADPAFVAGGARFGGGGLARGPDVVVGPLGVAPPGAGARACVDGPARGAETSPFVPPGFVNNPFVPPCLAPDPDPVDPPLAAAALAAASALSFAILRIFSLKCCTTYAWRICNALLAGRT
jgi:hypothetical protein